MVCDHERACNSSATGRRGRARSRRARRRPRASRLRTRGGRQRTTCLKRTVVEAVERSSLTTSPPAPASAMTMIACRSSPDASRIRSRNTRPAMWMTGGSSGPRRGVRGPRRRTARARPPRITAAAIASASATARSSTSVDGSAGSGVGTADPPVPFDLRRMQRRGSRQRRRERRCRALPGERIRCAVVVAVRHADPAAAYDQRLVVFAEARRPCGCATPP